MPNWETAQGSSASSAQVTKSLNPPNLYPTRNHPGSNLIFLHLCTKTFSSMINLLQYYWYIFFARSPQTPEIMSWSSSSTVSWILICNFPISVYIQILFHLCIHPINLPPYSKSLCLQEQLLTSPFLFLKVWIYEPSPCPLSFPWMLAPASWLNVSPFLDLPLEINMPQLLFLAEL